ncbi:MAG: YebC/PmpR family DNA-binding transcriptional regulator [bacterium]|nr:YebC/PmpR family DNA-binding transcriptional regulator [bacterium]
MSGHSKWANIKRKKGAEDAKRGKLFTKLGRDIMQAAREGGGDENANARLKIAVQKAKENNMPKDNIERAVLRGTGKLEGIELEEITYEGYGTDGVAFVIDVLTDNKNRALGDIKNIFNKRGGSLASAGSVKFQFEQKGEIILAEGRHDFDTVFMVAAEAGADDVIDDDGTLTVYTPREAFGAVEEALRTAGYGIEESEIKWFPKNETELPVDKALHNMKIQEFLEELDDVQAVASNLALTDALMEAFETA